MTSPIVFGPQLCGSIAADGGGHREWLVPDGVGGYASGTISGIRTRRKHTLLTTAHAALASLDLTLTLPSGAHVALFTHQWESGAVSPEGHRYLETFTLADGLPRWRWRVGDVVVERELAMTYGRPALGVVHRVLSAPGPIGLAVAAMCTVPASPHLEHGADGVIVQDELRIAGPGWQSGGVWHVGEYQREDATAEDLWFAGTFVARLDVGDRMEISAWSGPREEPPPPASVVVMAARERARTLIETAKADGDDAVLVLAADHFLVRTQRGMDVVASYPHGDIDAGVAMTAYEGLFLETGRADEGRELLTAQAKPTGPDAGLDAPFWLVHAVDRHVVRTGDTDLAAELAGSLSRTMRTHLSGKGALTVDADELVRLRATPAQDARIGKPVEINALWINALGALADLFENAKRDSTELRGRLAKARSSFAARFRAPEGWLYDVIDGPASTYPLGAGAYDDDPSLRPNQLFAWSLPHAPLAGDPSRDASRDGDLTAIRAIGGALLTPLGLRTLGPNEYGYQGTSQNDPDGQQGTVRPWLIGPYADACAAAGLPTEGLLTGLTAHIRDWGVGSLSETADGNAPHRATGSPFSARAVAETLRVRGYAG